MLWENSRMEKPKRKEGMRSFIALPELCRAGWDLAAFLVEPPPTTP